MNEYLVVKWLHVLSSTILFGTGIGSAFYMFFASLNRDPRIVFFVTRWVVIADWVFTTTAIIVQPATGLWLVHLAGFDWTSAWILGRSCSTFSPARAGSRGVAAAADARDGARGGRDRRAAPRAIWRFFRTWIALGIPAFTALVVVFYLMVAKPL